MQTIRQSVRWGFVIGALTTVQRCLTVFTILYCPILPANARYTVFHVFFTLLCCKKVVLCISFSWLLKWWNCLPFISRKQDNNIRNINCPKIDLSQFSLLSLSLSLTYLLIVKRYCHFPGIYLTQTFFTLLSGSNCLHIKQTSHEFLNKNCNNCNKQKRILYVAIVISVMFFYF